jgi:hypothetical protein
MTESFTPEQKKYITSQLVAMKKQMDLELSSDLEKLRVSIVSEIMKKVSEQISQKVNSATATVVESLDKKINDNNKQIVSANNNQLQVVKQTTKELMLAVGQQVTDTVYNKVIGEINSTIVPQVDNLIRFVHYNAQDGGEIVTDYRRAVEAQSNAEDMKMLTNGNTSHVISQHVRTFFTADD